MRRWLGRRWRSTSFRSGVWSALGVGAIGVFLYATALLSYGLSSAANGFFHVAVLDQIESQTTNGIAPEDLEVRMYHADGVVNPSWTFWVLLDGDTVVASDGVIDPVALSEPYIDMDFYTDYSVVDTTIKQQLFSSWYVDERTFVSPEGRPLRALVAVDDLDYLDEQIKSDVRGVVPAIVLLAAVSAIVTSFFTRRSLRRVEAMRAAVEAITQDSLDQRVPLNDAADGIDKLAVTMNEMLERLQQATEQQNQFLADASHELRSPVAGLLAQLEVAAAYPDSADPDVLIPKLEAEAQRLQALLNDLLYVSRSNAGNTNAPAAAADTDRRTSIDAIIDAEVEHQTLLGTDVTLDVTDRSDARIVGKRRDLERIVRNLVDNAVRHANTTVEIGSRRDGYDVIVWIADDGPGIPADDAERIFDRFVRLDEARTRDSGGAGLGLAIARQIAQKHGGDLWLAESSSGARFEFRLPARIKRMND